MHPAHQRTGPAVYTRLPTNALPPWSQTLRQWRWIFDLLQRSLDLQISWHDFGPFSHVRGKVTCHSHGGMNLNCNFNVFWTILSSGFSKKNKKHVNLGIYVYNFELLIYWVIGSLWISTFFFGFLGLEKSLFFFIKVRLFGKFGTDSIWGIPEQTNSEDDEDGDATKINPKYSPPSNVLCTYETLFFIFFLDKAIWRPYFLGWWTLAVVRVAHEDNDYAKCISIGALWNSDIAPNEFHGGLVSLGKFPAKAGLMWGSD